MHNTSTTKALVSFIKEDLIPAVELLGYWNIALTISVIILFLIVAIK